MKMKSFGIVLAGCLALTAAVQPAFSQEITFPAAQKAAQASAAADKEIVAEGIGAGTTKQDAIRDAMRKAIEKAVGMYVSAKTTMTDQELKEQIIVTSDAVVTNYKELDSSERNGIWVVRIEAKVLPNEYLKYAPKLVTQDVALDFANLLNTTQAMDNAKEMIDDIFDGEYYRIYRFEKTAVRLGEKAELNSNNVSVEIDYTLKFDEKEYDKFQKRFCALLDKIAKYKYEGERYSCLKANRTVEGKVFSTIGMEEAEKDNFRCIIFMSKKGSQEKKEICNLYFIRKEIFDLILPKIVNKAFLVFSFLPADGTETIKNFVKAEIEFGDGNWGTGRFDRPKSAENGIIFKRWEHISINTDHVYYEASIHNEGKGPFVNTLRMKDVPKDFLGQLKELYIYVLDNKDDLDENERIERANEIEKEFWKQK